MYKIDGFGEVFHPISNCCYDNPCSVFFPISIATTDL